MVVINVQGETAKLQNGTWSSDNKLLEKSLNDNTIRWIRSLPYPGFNAGPANPNPDKEMALGVIEFAFPGSEIIEETQPKYVPGRIY